MGKWTKTTAGLLFLAASAVYADREIAAALRSEASEPARTVAVVTPIQHKQVAHVRKAITETVIAAPAEASTDVKLLEDSADPFASGNAAPSTQPAAGEPIAATTQPTEGQSVSSTEVSVSDAGTVEIHVNDANLVEVLRMLSLQSQRNIIASKEVRGTVTANLYDVTVREALDAILHANGYSYREKGSFIYVYTTKELADIEKSERQMKTEVFRLFHTPAANASTLVKPVMSSGGQMAVTTPSQTGITSGAAGGGGNDHAGEDMLVITDYPENLDAVRKILVEVDKRPQQILLEATILRASLTEDNALGVDFTLLGGTDFSSLVANGMGAGDILSGNVVTPNGAPNVAKSNAAAANTGFTSQVPAGGMRVGLVTSNVAVFLSALEQTTDTTVLANPKVLTLNKQKGEVFVGNEDGYYTTVTTETTTSQQVETLKTGTRLIFRPYIAADGFIRLEVHPEDSDGAVNAQGLPSKRTTEVTTGIMVKDGHTIVIGGLFRESSSTGRSQVPFLGNIPLAGLLFKNQRDRTVRDEVIILLTPHIVKDESAYTSMSEEQARHAEDLRVGVRKGMMPWGRERLAESSYEAAKRELNKPKPDRQLAIWHLNSATNLNPKFTEAIELKEQLSGKVLSESDNSSIRGFVKQAVMRDVVPVTQPTADATDEIEHAAPTSQPFATATTQPGATTQPSDALVDGLTEEELSANSPTTKPSEAVAESDTKSEDDMAEATTDEAAEAIIEAPKGESSVADSSSEAVDMEETSATTQPSDNSTVTELSTEEVAPGVSDSEE